MKVSALGFDNVLLVLQLTVRPTAVREIPHNHLRWHVDLAISESSLDLLVDLAAVHHCGINAI